MELLITSATVPAPLDCVITDQNWQSLAALLRAQLTDPAEFNEGSSTPDPSNRGKPWVRTNTNGTPGGLWVYASGYWLSPHRSYDPQTDMVLDEVIMWTGDEADIDALDGGEAGTVTEVSGPMWQKLAAIAGRFPLAPGTFPSGAVVNVNDTGGEEKHVLVKAELPKLYANEFVVDESVASGGTFRLDDNGLSPRNRRPITIQDGSNTGHNTVPPYYSLWFLVKTGRKFYRLPG